MGENITALHEPQRESRRSRKKWTLLSPKSQGEKGRLALSRPTEAEIKKSLVVSNKETLPGCQRPGQQELLHIALQVLHETAQAENPSVLYQAMI